MITKSFNLYSNQDLKSKDKQGLLSTIYLPGCEKSNLKNPFLKNLKLILVSPNFKSLLGYKSPKFS